MPTRIPETVRGAGATASPDGAEATASAYGLRIVADRPLQWLDGAAEPNQLDVRLELSGPDGLSRAEEFGSSERIFALNDPAGRPWYTIDYLSGAGYLLTFEGQGQHFVAEDGREIAAAPPRYDGAWSMFLAAQVLPLVAVLGGREVLHASAVSLGGCAVGLVAATGCGKSSLAARLLLRGAALVTDDVLALDEVDGRVCAFPGPGTLKLRPAEEQLLTESERARLGASVQRDHEGHWRAPDARERASMPLGAVYFIRRTDRPTLQMEPLADARMLLAASFVGVVRTSRRLERQLEMCAAVDRDAAAWVVDVPADVGAAALAARIEEHFHETERPAA